MGYYMGDYRRGDYYRGTAGDPFLGGLFSKVFSVGKSLLGLGGGGVSSGAIEKAVQTGITKSFPGVGMVGGGLRKVSGLIKAHPVITGAGAAGIIGAVAGRAEGMAGMIPAHARGFHVSRKTGKVVRNRHMNPCNPRALRRAIRRTHSFARLAMHTIHLVHPKKAGRFGGFKKRRKK